MTLLPDTSDWSASDWRRLIGIVFLGAGGVACTVIAGSALTVIAEKSSSPWPAAYFGYGCLVLIGIVLTGLSAILGRRTFKLKLGGNTVESLGEDTVDAIQKAAEQP
ncbi:hypothetical protein NUH86_01820 [Sphingobium sp. JS3065]|uniref:hypothetical protein n=1 Tax=Sphingobium sp. JS3065 TaxID=2970925 RepID=UPI0022651D49|nr:hypothetical protein [Sphingobium sp. JS3065]UZW55569.1 hypothetical protein NUH86_01820 [Sphingobium sp. JS3065]